MRRPQWPRRSQIIANLCILIRVLQYFQHHIRSVAEVVTLGKGRLVTKLVIVTILPDLKLRSRNQADITDESKAGQTILQGHRKMEMIPKSSVDTEDDIAQTHMSVEKGASRPSPNHDALARDQSHQLLKVLMTRLICLIDSIGRVVERKEPIRWQTGWRAF